MPTSSIPSWQMTPAFLGASFPCPIPRNNTYTPRCSYQPPSSRPRRRVRVPRDQTSQATDWSWKGGTPPPQWLSEADVLRTLERLSASFARIAQLSAKFLRSVGQMLERKLYPDTETELVVEYGVAEPSATDKDFVDPLRDWEVSRETYYKDSFGRRVYLQLDGGVAGAVVGVDFRERVEGEEEEVEKETDVENGWSGDGLWSEWVDGAVE